MDRLNPPHLAHPAFAFDQGRLITGASALLFASGQVGDRRLDLAGQLAGALDNVAAVLAEGGLDLADIVSLRIYTTDVAAFLAAWPQLVTRFAPGAVPPNSLLGVRQLAHPDTLIDIEAIAAR